MSPHAGWILYELGLWESHWGGCHSAPRSWISHSEVEIHSKDPPFLTLAKCCCRQVAKSREGWVGCKKKGVSICLYVCTLRSAVKPSCLVQSNLFLILNVLR